MYPGLLNVCFLWDCFLSGGLWTIFRKCVGRSRGAGTFGRRRNADVCWSDGGRDWDEGRCAVVCVDTHNFERLFLWNVAETSRFDGATIFRSSGSSTESVLFSRATHMRNHHFNRRDGVKSNMSSGSDKNSTGTAITIPEKNIIYEIAYQ